MKLFILSLIFVVTTLSVAGQNVETVSELTPDPKLNYRAFRTNDSIVGGFGLRSDYHWKASLFQTTLSSGKEVTAIDIRTTNKDIAFERDGSIYTAKCNFFVKIGSADRKVFGWFEDSMNISVTESEIKEAGAFPSNYPVVFRRYFDLPPGKYEIYLAARDVKAGVRLTWVLHYTVPKS